MTMRHWLFPLLFALQHTMAQDRRLVITVDDLPCANCPEGTWEEVTDDLLRTLQAHRVPAVGFVNEGKLYRDGALDSTRMKLLERWLDEGLELGNHTFAHLGATRHPLAAYEADVVQGEELLRPLVEGRGSMLRYFRHPFLQAGPTVGYRDSLNTVIAQRGYTIAPVTLDNDEYIFAACYQEAQAADDTALATRLQQQYLDHMMAITRFQEEQCMEFLGRPIPHILLLHANTLNAEMLDALLKLYVDEGYAFVTLEEALRDPCYSMPESVTRFGYSWVRRWQEAAGQRPPWPPGIPAEVQRQYERLRAR